MVRGAAQEFRQPDVVNAPDLSFSASKCGLAWHRRWRGSPVPCVQRRHRLPRKRDPATDAGNDKRGSATNEQDWEVRRAGGMKNRMNDVYSASSK